MAEPADRREVELMMNRASQRDRVLRLLVERGARGVIQRDFLPPGVVDGGKPIARLASRIEELRNDDGLKIVSAGRRSGYEVYRLADPATAPKPAPRLFDTTRPACAR